MVARNVWVNSMTILQTDKTDAKGHNSTVILETDAKSLTGFTGSFERACQHDSTTLPQHDSLFAVPAVVSYNLNISNTAV